MTLQQIRVFLAVCKELNYSRAAERVYMTRQAVRQNITGLEKEFGGSLFGNRRNHLYLTDKGRLLKDRADALMEKYEELLQAMTADIFLKRPLRVGLSVSVVPDYLPELLGDLDSFTEIYPNIPIDKIRIKNDEAAGKLKEGVLDAAIILDMNTGSSCVARSVLTSHPSAVLMKNENALFDRDQIRISELNGSVMYLPGQGLEFSPLFENACRDGIKITFVTMPSYYQVLYYIQDHGGIALNRYLPGDDPDPASLRSIPLQEMPPLCSSYLTREDETGAALLLRDWLTEKIRDNKGKASGTR